MADGKSFSKIKIWTFTQSFRYSSAIKLIDAEIEQAAGVVKLVRDSGHLQSTNYSLVN